MVEPRPEENRLRVRDRPFSDLVPEHARRHREAAARRGRTGPHGLRKWAIRASAPWRALPDFLVIGAQKSGTTSLFHYLAQHPELVPSRIKEPAFLHHWSGETSLNRYRAQFPLEAGLRWRGKLCFEATPETMYFPQCPHRARALPGERRFVAILRDPAARAISHYTHMLSHQRVTDPIEDIIGIAPPQDEGYVFSAEDPLGWRHPRPGYDIVARGIYDVQLARWFDVFGRAAVKVVLFEDLKRAPDRLMAEICEFLGIAPFAFDTDEVHYRSFRVDIAPETRARLEARFAPANARLEKLLGISLPWS